MVSLSRKQREIQAREALILSEADRMVGEEGYLGLNLDHLAERIEYSKATVYNHFRSKEDLLLAVVLEHHRLRVRMFELALLYGTQSRERMCCLGAGVMLLTKSRPHFFALDQLINAHSLWEKTDPLRQDTMRKVFQRGMDITMEVIRQAKMAGDLPNAVNEKQVLHAMIALTKGTFLMESDCALPEDGKPNPQEILLAHYNTYLDGVGWQPLSSEFDYFATIESAQDYIKEHLDI